MIKFILIILIIFFLIIFLGFGLLLRVVNFLGFGKRTNQSNKRRNYDRRNQRQYQTDPDTDDYASSGNRKVFGKDEGEYVDYEEIK